MPGSAVIATHERAGRVEPTRLAVRVSEPTAVHSAGSAPLAQPVPFAAGEVRIGPVELQVEVDANDSVACVDARVRNASGRAIRLESVVLGFRWTGHGTEALRFLRHGWQSWSFTGSRPLDADGEPAFPSGAWLRGLHHTLGAPPDDRSGWHESELLTVAGASPAGPACCVGVLERGRVFGIVYLRPAGEDVEIELELRLDAELAPGASRALDRARVALGLDAGVLLEAHAEAHGRLAGARTSAPFVSGWCSWYHFFQGVTEGDLLRNLEALAAARDEIPIELVQLDDGYQRAVGDWLETNEKFPRGIDAVAQEIRAAGFVPGLWTAPFCAVEASGLFAEHRDWLLHGDKGPHRGLHHPGWSPDGAVYVLDASRPEVTGHLESLGRGLVERGFRFLKLDFLYAGAMQALAHDASLGRAERLRCGLEAIRRGAGEECFLLGCGCPLGAAVGVVDGMRIGPDVAPRWALAADASIPGLEESLPATRSAVRSILARVWMHRRLWINDPDCLMARADADLSDAEARTLASAIGASGGALLFSDDVPQLSAERRALVRETLETARRIDALGLPGRARAPDLLASEFAPDLVASSGEGATVALLNAGDEKARRSVSLEAAGAIPLQGPAEPLLSTRAPESGPRGRLEITLEPHESACFRLRRAVPLAVFCDFDGTFSVQDVGATLARRHAGGRRPELWARYERGELSAWDYNMEVLDGLELPRAEVDRFLETVELDPGARSLVAWCEERGVPFRVLSDGFDANLNRIQQLQGVRFGYDANALRYDGGRWRLRAGHPNPACSCGTGTCKRGRIEAFRARRPGATIVHVGNGRVSDLCGALAADVAFAKDTLAQELQARGRAFEPFATLHDVIPGLERLLGAG